MEVTNNYIKLILLVLFFDIIGAHLYSKITILVLIVVVLNNLEPSNKAYEPVELSDEIEL